MNRMRHRLISLVGRTVQLLRDAFYRVVSTNAISGAPRRLQPIQCNGLGVVTIGDNVTIGFHPSPSFFSTYAYLEARKESASISIGSRTSINNNFCAIAEHTSIIIGEDCLIGVNVEILDSDFHSLKFAERGISTSEWAQPVTVGNKVFLGSNVKILKGVSIGEGSVVANGTVVTKNIPSHVIAGGNPVRVIRALD